MRNMMSGKFVLKGIFISLCLAMLIWFSPMIHAAPGDVDLRFNAGAITSQFFQEAVRAIAVQPDGKILIGGLFNVAGGASRNGLARLNADGSLDTGFVPPPFSQSDLVNPIRIAVQPDGKIIVAGKDFRISNILYQLIRLNADGSLDASFSLLSINSGRGIEGLALQTDGKILIGGDFFLIDNVERRVVARLNSNGTLDTSFAIGLPPGTFGGRSAAITVQPNDKIIIGGEFFLTVGATTLRNVARLNSNGTPDVTFNVAGDEFDVVRAIILQADGKVFIGGNSSSNIGSRSPLARVNPDGSLDSSFNAPFGSPRQVFDVALEPNGKVIAVGNFCTLPSAPGACAINRFNTDGSRDSFYPLAISPCGSNGPDNTPLAIVRQPNGKILVGGRFGNISCIPRQRIVRLQNLSIADDFDGDGSADLSVFRPSNGTWYLNRSTSGFYAQQFGISTDKLVPADYDGDGRTDIAVWREAPTMQAAFYIFQSTTNTVRIEQFGQTGDDSTVVGDWDGDGKADIAVYRNAASGAQSYFFYRGSLNNPGGNTTFLAWGTNGDKAVRGDFEGDGKIDLAVFRPSTNLWYIKQSSNALVRYENWGVSTDKFVPADYDSDGKTDLAVFRNGVWYILQSSDNLPLYRFWGLNTDSLVPADYDGDGKADSAVYRGGVWYILQSSDAVAQYFNFGLSNDKPVPAAYIP